MISIIIPTKDEKEAIRKVLDEMNQVMEGSGLDYEIIVVDASEDKTPEIARKKGARVINQTEGRKGTAMKVGAEEAKGEIIVFTDGDYTYPATKIPEMVEELKQDEYQMVTGSRFKEGIENITWFHKLGNKFFISLASLLYNPTTDVLTGLRAIQKEDLLSLDLKEEGFGIESEIHAKASKKGWKIKEIPIKYRRRHGESKLSSFKTGSKILKTLLKNAF